MNIRTIVFDMGGVLIDLDKQQAIQEFSEMGAPGVVNYLNEYRQSGIFLDLEEGKVSGPEFCNQFRALFDVKVTDDQITDAFIAFTTQLPLYKLEMIRSLREKGFRTVMLSNTNEIMMPTLIDRYFTQEGLTIHDYFDHLYLSYEMKCSKPSREIFEKIIHGEGGDPSTLLLIDDSPANCEMAQKMGFSAYCAQPEEDFRHLFEQW